MSTSIPYASATSDARAHDDIKKILRKFDCEAIGFMHDYTKHEVLLAFTHRGRQYQIPVSAQGWAQLYLKQNPWTSSRRDSRVDYEQKWLKQGYVAVNSILRDSIKGQITSIECGIVKFEVAFLPYMLTSDGRPVIERLAKMNLLPSPESAKVVPLK